MCLLQKWMPGWGTFQLSRKLKLCLNQYNPGVWVFVKICPKIILGCSPSLFFLTVSQRFLSNFFGFVGRASLAGGLLFCSFYPRKMFSHTLLQQIYRSFSTGENNIFKETYRTPRYISTNNWQNAGVRKLLQGRIIWVFYFIYFSYISCYEGW